LMFMGVIRCTIYRHQIHYPVIEAMYEIGWALGQVIFYYFVAVDPMPPGKNKLAEFVKNLFKVLTPVKNEN
jgi:hypothetical protein